MKFVKSVNSSEGQAKLAQKLSDSLSSGPVLWLVSGGSNIQIEVNVLNQLEKSLTSNLKILLSDERFGPKGHKDSNYYQLMSSGLNLKNASFPDILQGNPSPEEAKGVYLKMFNKFKGQSKVIGQFGIGDDGHIAGVLPFTLGATTLDSVVYYESRPYNRLSLSLRALKDIDISYVFCFGANKLNALKRLKAAQESLDSFPSLILNDMKNVTVYNDQLEEGE